jgi:hypothetical protein
MVSYAQQVKYRMQRKIVTEQVLENNQDHIIITNEVQKRLLNYYSGFDEKISRRILSYKEFEANTSIEGDKLILLNDYTRYLSGMEHADLPYYARQISSIDSLVFEHRELKIALYELTEFSHPEYTHTVLLSSLNEFEKPEPFWKQNDLNLSTDIKFAGEKSNRVTQFSSTFDYPVDSLKMIHSNDLLVQCRLQCYAVDRSSANIVVSLENKADTYFWEALEINKYIKAYANWWPVSFNVAIPGKDLTADSRLKIYVWCYSGDYQ